MDCSPVVTALRALSEPASIWQVRALRGRVPRAFLQRVASCLPICSRTTSTGVFLTQGPTARCGSAVDAGFLCCHKPSYWAYGLVVKELDSYVSRSRRLRMVSICRSSPSRPPSAAPMATYRRGHPQPLRVERGALC